MLRHQRGITLLINDAIRLSESYLVDLKQVMRDEADSHFGFRILAIDQLIPTGYAIECYGEGPISLQDLHFDDKLWLYSYTVDVGG